MINWFNHKIKPKGSIRIRKSTRDRWRYSIVVHGDVLAISTRSFAKWSDAVKDARRLWRNYEID